MYERFTQRVRKVMLLANQEAQRLKNDFIGTEHILSGLVKEEGSVATDLLKALGMQLTAITSEIEKCVPRGDSNIGMYRLGQTNQAKNVIAYAMEESRLLGDEYVGTEHILLGLLRENEGLAAQVLKNLGLRVDRVRQAVRTLLQRDDDGSNEVSPAARIQRNDDEANHQAYQNDEDTTKRARHLAEEIVALQQDKEEAMAIQKFIKAVQFRDKQDEKKRELAAINIPGWTRRNIEQAVGLTSAFKFPCLDSLNDKVGEPDPRVLSSLPNPLTPPVKFVVGLIPQFPVSTLKAIPPFDDIGSPYFHALVPLISLESVTRFKGGDNDLIPTAFTEIERAKDRSKGRAVLLCVVRPTSLSQDVQKELFAGIHQTNCDFILFEEASEVDSVLAKLPTEAKLLEKPR